MLILERYSQMLKLQEESQAYFEDEDVDKEMAQQDKSPSPTTQNPTARTVKVKH